MKGREVFVSLAIMFGFYFTIGVLGGDLVTEFVNSEAFYGWLILKNVLIWFAFLAVGVWIGRHIK